MQNINSVLVTNEDESGYIGDEKQLKRFFAHDWGHLAGLDHPDKDTDVPEARNDQDNLMWQSKKSMGTHIIQEQIDKIKKEFEK